MTMRKVGITLVVASFTLTAVRLCTGIVYAADESVSSLVLRAPAFPTERTETAAAPVERDIVIDSDEMELVYAPLYLRIMKAAPIAIAVMAAAGLALLVAARRRA